MYLHLYRTLRHRVGEPRRPVPIPNPRRLPNRTPPPTGDRTRPVPHPRCSLGLYMERLLLDKRNQISYVYSICYIFIPVVLLFYVALHSYDGKGALRFTPVLLFITLFVCLCIDAKHFLVLTF